MPKLTEADFDRKKNNILDSTYRLALNNSISEISIRDIIKECKISQGAIYIYFKNIDDIYISLVNREFKDINLKQKADNIFLNENIPEVVILEYITILKNNLFDNIVGIGKIYYELINMYVTDSEKLLNFMSKCNISKEYAYVQNEFNNFLSKNIRNGYFKTKYTANDVQTYIDTFFDGLIRNAILSKYYSNGKMLYEKIFNIDTLVEMLYKSIINFLYMDYEIGVNNDREDRTVQ